MDEYNTLLAHSLSTQGFASVVVTRRVNFGDFNPWGDWNVYKTRNYRRHIGTVRGEDSSHCHVPELHASQAAEEITRHAIAYCREDIGKLKLYVCANTIYMDTAPDGRMQFELYVQYHTPCPTTAQPARPCAHETRPSVPRDPLFGSVYCQTPEMSVRHVHPGVPQVTVE
jgi:hypothetical protein